MRIDNNLVNIELYKTMEDLLHFELAFNKKKCKRTKENDISLTRAR